MLTTLLVILAIDADDAVRAAVVAVDPVHDRKVSRGSPRVDETGVVGAGLGAFVTPATTTAWRRQWSGIPYPPGIPTRLPPVRTCSACVLAAPARAERSGGLVAQCRS
jgi:hypothetical protein